MHALTSSARPTSRRPAIVRANGPLFYCVAIAAFLETLAAERAETLLPLESTLNERVERSSHLQTQRRAAFLRDYVQQTWPELDWSSALEQYRAALTYHGVPTPYRATPGREALGRCTNMAQAALFYRAVGRWSDDHALRTFARAAAIEAADGFAQFRVVFQDRARRERLSAVKSWRTVRACVRQARDVRVRLAFEALNAHCGPNPAFPTMDYAEFLQRMRSVIARCAAPLWLERFLFSDWHCAPLAAAAAPKPESGPLRFRPVFAQAA